MPASAKSPDPTLLWCTGCEQPLAPDSFWPDTYADLTAEIVIGWVQGKLDVPAIEAALQVQLDEQAAPSKAAGVPWA